MKVLKNMEVLFTVAAAFACAAAYVSVTQPQAPASIAAAPSAQVAAGTETPPMQVVVIRGKRMSAQEKQQSLLEERKQTLLASNESHS